MSFILRFISSILNIYMLIIFFRLILTWFPGMTNSRVYEIVSGITDPYLSWFRRFGLRIGSIDLSPLLAIGVLSILNRVISILAVNGYVGIGIILAMVLMAAWGILSFLIGFFVIILILRVISHYANVDNYSQFWGFIERFSHHILSWINRFFLKDRIRNTGTSIIVSIVIFGILYFIINFLVFQLSGLLINIPL